MDRAKLPPPNTFAGLSLVLNRVAESRDESVWIVEQARSPEARYLLLDASGEAFLRRDGDALRWLDVNEREQWLGELHASLLGIAYERPHFLLVVDDPARIGELEGALDARRMNLRSAGLRPTRPACSPMPRACRTGSAKRAFAPIAAHRCCWSPPAIARNAPTRTARACTSRAPMPP